jgi:hypothetical protein
LSRKLPALIWKQLKAFRPHYDVYVSENEAIPKIFLKIAAFVLLVFFRQRNYICLKEFSMVIAKPETEVGTECIHGNDCPIHSANPPFNAVTLAAMQEARDIASGRIPGKWHHSIEEMREELGI